MLRAFWRRRRALEPARRHQLTRSRLAPLHPTGERAPRATPPRDRLRWKTEWDWARVGSCPWLVDHRDAALRHEHAVAVDLRDRGFHLHYRRSLDLGHDALHLRLRSRLRLDHHALGRDTTRRQHDGAGADLQ